MKKSIESDIPAALPGCQAVVEFSNQDGSASGIAYCPIRKDVCVLGFLNNEGYRTGLQRGKCACGVSPSGSTVDAMKN